MLFRILRDSSLNLPCIFRVLGAVKTLYHFGLANLKDLGAGLFFYNSVSQDFHDSKRQQMILHQLPCHLTLAK